VRADRHSTARGARRARPRRGATARRPVGAPAAALRLPPRPRPPRAAEPLPDRRARGAAQTPPRRRDGGPARDRGAAHERGDRMTVLGRVPGTQDAMPLEFWVAVEPGQYLQLDDVIEVTTELPDGREVRLYGGVGLG